MYVYGQINRQIDGYIDRERECVRDRERQGEKGGERYNAAYIADDFAYIASAANLDDSISIIDFVVIVIDDVADVVDVADVALANDPRVFFCQWCISSKGPSKTQPRTKPFRFGSRFPQLLCPFSSSNSFLLDSAIIQRLH